MDDGSLGEKRWTLLELLNWTAARFKRVGIDEARLNAELLLGKVTGLERIMLYARFDQEPTASQLDELRELVRRRASRHPLQYLLGRCEFYGRDFEVTPAVLVPRQETELVVDKCLEKIGGDGSGTLAADVGTGSGIIAVTLACERPGLRVAATDSSPDALALARCNAARHGVADRVEFACGDLCEALPAGMREGLALIASNPPYVPSAQIAGLQPEVREHEPRAALDGGPDGLDVVRRLLPEAAEALGEGGWLVVELGEDQAPVVRRLIEDRGLGLAAESVETVRDGCGCERVLAVRRAALA